MSSRRVLLVGGRGGGGEEVFVRDLARYPPPGYEYDLVLEPHESVPGARSATVRAVAINRLVHPWVWPVPGVRAYHVDERFSLVHVHNHSSWLDLPEGVPLVYTVGGSSYLHYMERYLGWERERLRVHLRRTGRIFRLLGVRSELVTSERIDAVVVFSEYARDWLVRGGVDPARLHVVPPGFDVAAPPPWLPTSPFRCLLVGRDPERKGADLAVGAVRSLRAAGVDVRLTLVGDESYPAAAAAAGDGVDGWPPVSRERLATDFYAQTHAVLVPSRAEGYGFAAVEGMAHGRAVLVSDVDALPEIVGASGVVVPAGSPTAWKDAVGELAADPERARRLGTAARRRFERRFRMDVARAEMGRVYDQVLARVGS